MIKTGIIGLGKMGISHCAILGTHQDINLVAVCDASSLVLEAFKKHSKYQCFSDHKRMIDSTELDAIVIASPTRFHDEMVSYALEKRLHVFCEKPFSLEYAKGKELAKRAKQLNLVNQVGYHNRFIGTFIEMKRLLKGGVIGPVYHFLAESYGPVVLKETNSTWRSKPAEGGGCLYDYASHTIDLVNFLLGRPVKVSGTQLKTVFSKNVEDAVYATLTLESGISGQLSVNWSDETHRKMNTRITAIGKRGQLIADSTELKIYVTAENSTLNLEKGWTIKNITELAGNVNFYLRGEEYSAQIDYFINAIKSKSVENKSSFENACQTDQLISMLQADGAGNH